MDLDASVGVHWGADEYPADVLAELLRQAEAAPSPKLDLAIGLVSYLLASFDSAVAHLERAYLDYKSGGDVRRAALAAAHLGRVQHDGIGNRAAAAGWFARGRRLLADDPDCVERGWVILALVGCSMTDVDQLEADSAQALDLARRYADVDLECKALADSGIAMVSHGRVATGLAALDESMTMATSGECTNRFIAAQVICCLLSGCERAGDLPRLEAWLSEGDRRLALNLDAPPSLLAAHCQSEYASLLCQVARWPEADATLRHAVASSEGLHHRARLESRVALARLRVGQGRLQEAAVLLEGLEQAPEAQAVLADLHFARGDDDLAAAAARQALRALVGDRLRSAPLLELLVRVECRRGNPEAAGEVASALRELAAQPPPHAPLRAIAALGAGRVAAAAGDTVAARSAYEEGLAGLGTTPWPLLAAQLHLALAHVVADVPTAATEARAALAVFGAIGAREASEAQQLLHRLGVGAAAVLAGGAEPLTTREREILRLLGEGMSNPQIAKRLVISPKTAEHHVSSILRKLRLRSRNEAALYAASQQG